MACSVVTVVDSIADEFVEKLVDAANNIKMGNGLEENVFLGPVIRQSHLDKVKNYIDLGVAENAELIRDGRLDVKETDDGYFLGATIFDHVNEDMTIWKEEVFAPVLSIVRVKDLTEAIEIANKSEFANGAVIYTDSGKAVRQYRETMEAGMLGVNVNIPAPMAFFPFSGWKKSFYGDLHANGKDGVEFFTRKKMITTRWE